MEKEKHDLQLTMCTGITETNAMFLTSILTGFGNILYFCEVKLSLGNLFLF